jgi:ABC-type glycerol-3-phosphate transport system substrate-binding protein
MKKWISMTLALLLLLGLLVGCGSTQVPADDAQNSTSVPADSSTQVSENANASDEKIEITFAWVNLEESRQQIWRDYVFQPYMDKHPNVTIKEMWIPDLQNSIRVMLASGAGPDMFYMDSIDIPDLSISNRIIDLEKYRKQYNLDNIMYDWAINACSYKGILYGLPHSIEATAMTYNKTLLDKLGMPVPTTREEYVNVCEAAKKNGYIPVAIGYSGQLNFLQWIYEHYLTTYAGEKTIQLLKGEIGFDDPDIRGAFELMKADWDAGYFNDKKAGAITNDEARAMFSNQKAVLNTEGAWLTLADVEPGTWDFEWGQTKWPSMKDGVPAASGIAVGESIAINSNAAHPDQIVEMMMDFYTNEKVAVKAVASGFSTPAVPISDDAYPEDMHPDIRKALDAQANNMKGVVGYAPWAFYPAGVAMYIYDNLDKVFYDQMSMDDFLKGCQETIEEDFTDGYVFAGK